MGLWLRLPVSCAKRMGLQTRVAPPSHTRRGINESQGGVFTFGHDVLPILLRCLDKNGIGCHRKGRCTTNSNNTKERSVYLLDDAEFG